MIDPVVLLALTLLVVAVGKAVGLELGDLRASTRRARQVMAVALHLLRDRSEAEDVVQETFLELWRRAPTFDPARGPREAFAVLIARSRALDRLRARGSALRAAELAAADPPVPQPSPVELSEARQRSARVRSALDALPATQREAIELAYFRGLTQTEIAARTGEPLGTVKTRLRLAMEKLAAQLMEAA
jgi:RNA polymerase sigma-70 factor (ECF subfamily)